MAWIRSQKSDRVQDVLVDARELGIEQVADSWGLVAEVALLGRFPNRESALAALEGIHQWIEHDGAKGVYQVAAPAAPKQDHA